MPTKQDEVKKQSIELIDRFLGQLSREHYLTAEEIAYNIVGTKPDDTKIIVHDRLMNIIAQQPPAMHPSRHNMSFEKNDEETWIMTAKAGGLELPYFCTILKSVLERLNREKRQRVHANRQEIEDALDSVIEVSNLSIVCPRESKYKKRIYYAIVYVGHEKVTYKNRDATLLCREIKLDLPGKLKDKSMNNSAAD